MNTKHRAERARIVEGRGCPRTFLMAVTVTLHHSRHRTSRPAEEQSGTEDFNYGLRASASERD